MILIVEDQYLVADELRDIVEKAGARVIGPAARTAGARVALLGAALNGIAIDGAIVDINLGGEWALEFVSELERCRVPYIVVTGYPDELLSRHLPTAPHLIKPIGDGDLVALAERTFRAPR